MSKISLWRLEKVFKDRVISIENGNTVLLGTPEEIVKEIVNLTDSPTSLYHI